MSLPRGPQGGPRVSAPAYQVTMLPFQASHSSLCPVQAETGLTPHSLISSLQGPSAFSLPVPLCLPSLLPLVRLQFPLALPSLSLSHHFSAGTHLSLPLHSRFSPSYLLFTLPSSFSLSLFSLFSFLYPL